MKIGKLNINPLGLVHQLGASVAGLGIFAHQAQGFSDLASSLIAVHPKGAAIVTALGTLSTLATHLIDKNAKDKLAQALVNSPAVVTPVGVGIPEAGQ